MDITSLVQSFLTSPTGYVVTRTQRGTTFRGRTSLGAQSTLTINASVQPIKGNDLKLLPEGRRSEESRVVYTDTQLLIGGYEQPTEADVVTIDGEDWEAHHVEVWRDALSGNVGYRCIVTVKRGSPGSGR